MRRIRKIETISLDEKETRKKEQVLKHLIFNAVAKRYIRQNGDLNKKPQLNLIEK